MRRRRFAWLPIVLLLLVVAAACRPSDPRAEVLKQRARWTVDLLSWVQGEDGQISLTVRVAGPPNSTLDELTFRINLLDAANETLVSEWRTVDLSQLARGGPKDLFFKVEPPDQPVEGLAVSVVVNPTAEQEQHIKELQSLPAAGG